MNPSTKPGLTPVLMVNFIGTLGYSITIPFLVFLVDKFGGNEFIYGVIGSVYPAFQFFGTPALGRWSDKYGRRKILFLSQAGTLLAWLIFMVALLVPRTSLLEIDSTLVGSFTLTIPLLILFIARALDGIIGGNVSLANAYLSDVSTEQNRKASFGKMAMSSSLGFILGTGHCRFIGNSTFYVAAVMLFIIFLLSFRLFRMEPKLINTV